MKFIRSVYSVLMVLIFVVPAAGLYYTRHSCDASGEVQFVLEQDYSCCADNSSMHCEMELEAEPVPVNTCCTEHDETITNLPVEALVTIEAPDEKCCTNEGNYLKTDEDYNSPVKTEIPHIEISITIASLFFLPVQASELQIEENAHSPPLILSSRDLLLQQGIMLI